MDTLRFLRGLTQQVTGALRWLPPTFARVAVGWAFAVNGWGKLHNLPAIVDFFRDLGIPAPELQAPFVAGTELVGGTLILMGLAARYAAIPLIISMLVAIATAIWPDVTSAADLFGKVEFLYIALLGWIAVEGAGPLSCDARVARRLSSAAAG